MCGGKGGRGRGQNGDSGKKILSGRPECMPPCSYPPLLLHILLHRHTHNTRRCHAIEWVMGRAWNFAVLASRLAVTIGRKTPVIMMPLLPAMPVRCAIPPRHAYSLWANHSVAEHRGMPCLRAPLMPRARASPWRVVVKPDLSLAQFCSSRHSPPAHAPFSPTLPHPTPTATQTPTVPSPIRRWAINGAGARPTWKRPTR